MSVWPFLLLVAVLTGCAHAPPPSAITKITLVRGQCSAFCTSSQYTFYPNGRIDYTDGVNKPIQARGTARIYHQLAEDLLRTPAFGRRSDYLTVPSQQPSTTVFIEYSGMSRQVRFPTVGWPFHDDPSYDLLNRWAFFAALDGDGAVAQARRGEVARLARIDTLEKVIFTSKGCYGTCPVFLAAFDRDGTATLRNARFMPGVAGRRSVNANARVAFDRVTELLSASRFSQLKPRYPFRVIDGYGVSFEFHYRDGYTYTVDAPDQTRWPLEVAGLVGGFDQLIRDSNWAPTR